MGLGKTYSTQYLLDSNNSSGVAGQVLSTTSTGIDWVDANTVPGTGLWLANGNDIYNSNSANVGIGTTNPAYKLVVYETGTATSNVAIDARATGAGTNNYAVWAEGSGASSTNFAFYGAAGKNAFLGDTGIGTDNPNEKLEVNGAVAIGNATDGIKLRLTGTVGEILGLSTTSGSYNDLDIRTQAATQLYLKTDGNVGIGTTSPDGNLEVVGTTVISTVTDGVNAVLIGLAGSNRTTIQLDTADTTHTNRQWGLTNIAGDFYVGRHGLNVMTMKNNGNVGIGTTLPGTKLEIDKADATTYASSTLAQNILRLQNTSATDNSFAAISFAVNNANSTTGITFSNKR
jgi:hypothetical protein